MINVLIQNLTRTASLCVVLALSTMSATATALPVDRPSPAFVFVVEGESDNGTVQSNCTSLSQAVEQVRRRGNVERVISAQTRVSGGREVHHIKVLTKDGKVRTHTVNGCKR